MQLSPISLAITRLGGVRFSPAALFPSGTAGAWYDPSDSTTLFSDTAGTTPSPTPGGGALSVVGLMLDKSQGLALGSELLTNPGPGFTVTTGWTSGRSATLSVNSGAIRVTNTVGYGQAYQAIATVVGTTYKVTATVTNAATLFDIFVGTTGPETGLIVQRSNNAAGTYTFYFTATTTTSWLTFGNSSVSAGSSFDLVSATLKALPGNHAISYNTTTARPELSARVNLLTYSEQFDNPAWFRVGGDITSTNTLAPDNTNTADTFTATSGSARHCILNTTAFAIISGAQYVNTMYIKKGNYNFITLIYLGLTTTTAWITVTVDFSGAVPVISKTGAGANATYTTSSVTNAGNGFYRVSVTGSVVSTTACVEVALSSSATPAYGTYGEEVWTAAGGETVIVWGADLRPANIGTSVPAYQRIADAYTYDSSGFPRYLVFNGTASGMYTPANLNLSGTDKATVFAGVRKISDASIQIIAETSAVVDSSNGALSVGSSIGSSQRWFSALRGTALAYYEPATYAAPISNVLATSFDIAGASIANEINPRVNGVLNQSNPTGANAGTGNFTSYPLSIGVRNAQGGAPITGFLNGYIYSLIVVGAASTAAQISSTESWINVKEGGVY